MEANDGPEALRLGEEQQARPIHLLLTDMVMPGGLNGRELAERLKTLRPELKVLFISGYTNEAIVQQSASEPGWAFLQKPFSPFLLIQKIREVLDAPIIESN